MHQATLSIQVNIQIIATHCKKSYLYTDSVHVSPIVSGKQCNNKIIKDKISEVSEFSLVCKWINISFHLAESAPLVAIAHCNSAC